MTYEDSAESHKVSTSNLASRTEKTVAAQPNDGGALAIRLTIPAKPEYITLGRLALTGIARLRAEPLSQEVLGDLKLALTEACTNSVRHAYAGGEGLVEIVYELHHDRLVVEVVDEGEGFEPPSADASALVDDELSEGGLGIALIQALADEFEIGERPQGGGSRLRFVKLLPAA
jgi:serine/threonine-protein kinase RsbW